MQHLLIRENRPSPFVYVVTASRFRLVAVELSEHPAEPPAVSGFEDVVEFSVETPTGLALVNSPGENWWTITRRTGDLRVRVHVRGRDAAVRAQEESDQESPSTGVLEEYAIQVWPAPKANFTVVQVNSADAASLLSGPPTPSAQPEECLDETEERTEAGIAAGNWVGSVLTQPISNQGATVSARVYMPGTPRKVARRFGNVPAWLGGSRSPTRLVVGDSTSASFRHIAGREAAVAGEGGYTTLTFTRVDLPHAVEATWNWYLPQPGQTTAVQGQGRAVLPQDSTLDLRFEPAESAEPRTRMTLTHSGLPDDWAGPMQRFWEWQLSTLPRRSTYR